MVQTTQDEMQVEESLASSWWVPECRDSLHLQIPHSGLGHNAGVHMNRVITLLLGWSIHTNCNIGQTIKARMQVDGSQNYTTEGFMHHETFHQFSTRLWKPRTWRRGTYIGLGHLLGPIQVHVKLNIHGRHSKQPKANAGRWKPEIWNRSTEVKGWL